MSPLFYTRDVLSSGFVFVWADDNSPPGASELKGLSDMSNACKSKRKRERDEGGWGGHTLRPGVAERPPLKTKRAADGSHCSASHVNRPVSTRLHVSSLAGRRTAAQSTHRPPPPSTASTRQTACQRAAFGRPLSSAQRGKRRKHLLSDGDVAG